MFQIKRVYDPPSKDDGTRILVDRLWPRGLKKQTARIDGWLRDIAPTAALRIWFGHAPRKWEEFKARYFRELDANATAVQHLHGQAGDTTTLLFAAKDLEHNNAAALQQYLEKKKRKPSAGRKRPARSGG